MNGLEGAAAELLRALYRNWYALPYRATVTPLDQERRALAAALRDGGDPAAALRRFVSAAASMSGVRDAAGAQLAEVERLLAGSTAPDQAARTRLADLADADDPFATALAAMFWQPAALGPALQAIRPQLHHPDLPDAEREQAEEVYLRLAGTLPQVRSSYQQTQTALEAALNELQAIGSVRRLVWRELLAAKVASSREISTVLGGVADLGSLATANGETFAANGEALAADGGATTVQYFSDVQFPREVKRSTDRWEPLTVRLTTFAQESSVGTAAVTLAFPDPDKPQEVEVVLTAPDFEERFDLWSRTIRVFKDRDSEPAIFLVQSDKPGKKRITVDFYHQGRHLASVIFETAVVTGTPSTAPARLLSEAANIESFPPDPPDPPDLELRIVRGNDDNRLVFTLHSAHARVGIHWMPAGEVVLTKENPFKFLEHRFERLSQLAYELDGAPTPEAAQRAQDEITTIGQQLWDEVIPTPFKDTFWPQMIRPLIETKTVRTLMITSDDPWIPWELVKPYSYNQVTGASTDEEFWAHQVAITRWLSGRGLADDTRVQTARLVIPDLDLEGVAKEQETLGALSAQHHIDIGTPLRTRDEVLALLKSGGTQLIHVSAHGSHDPDDPTLSFVQLQDNEVIRPADLGPTATEGLRKERPLVFLNACSVGRLGLGLTGLGGWAEALICTGRVGAFIGTLWEVNDALAAEFAAHFYTKLFDPATGSLGEAFQAARAHVRTLNPGNPTWLAYTLYGDPNSRVSPSA